MPKESPKNPLKYLDSGDYFVRVNIRPQQKVSFSTGGGTCQKSKC